MTCSLWAYAAIFAAALETHFGCSTSTQPLFVALFGVMVVPLTMRDLSEQKNVQTALAVGRTVMLVVMIVTAASVMIRDGPLDETRGGDDFLLAAPKTWRDAARASSVVAFAFALHHSVPQICEPVHSPARPAFELNLVFRRSFCAAALIYIAFAATVATYFGDATLSSANLDWQTYHTDEFAPEMSRALTKMLSQFVVLYPAINVVASYPLNAITLGDAILATHRQYVSLSPDAATPPGHKIAARVLAACPPLIGAALVSDISKITSVTGVFGIAMCAVVPGLVSLSAKRMVPGVNAHASALNGVGSAILLTIGGTLLTLSMVFV